MSLIRTFHPIGQGAFYTERHNYGKENFNIVYDCGSKTLSRLDLDRKIKSIFLKDDPIDILFISHFHEDHINGIETLKNHCKIRKVILPFIHSNSKILVKVHNFVNGFNNTQLIDDPQSFFGKNVTVISIHINENDESNKEKRNIDLSEVVESEEFESGIRFCLKKDIDWLFIPFNYKYDARVKIFEEALKKQGLNFSSIGSIEEMRRHKKKITKAYNSISRNLNETSMVLFSGSGKETEDLVHSYTSCLHYPFYTHFYSIQSGCLYMGDVNLRNNGIVNDLRTSLGCFMNNVGTIQIPHHGSIQNFNSSILNGDTQSAIFSYGTNNTYGHPSDRVIADVVAKSAHPFLVTEKQLSIVIQTT